MRRCCHRRRRRSRGDQCTPPHRQRRCSTSATCRHHHRFVHQSYSHCRRRSSPRRHRFRHLKSSSLTSTVTLPRPHTEPQRISGRTRSKTVKPSDQGLHHSVGLLSMMTKTALLSVVTTHGAVGAGHRNKPPSFGGRGQPSFSVGDHDEAPPVGGTSGISCAMAAMLAAREGIEVALAGQRPPYKPSDLPLCYASDLKVPRSPQGGYAIGARTSLEGFGGAEILWAAGCGDF